jgi:hypothetical protein
MGPGINQPPITGAAPGRGRLKRRGRHRTAPAARARGIVSVVLRRQGFRKTNR